jgi:hypothetical protein
MNDTNSPHPVKSLSSPLILIAAAIFWNNSAILAVTRGDAQVIGIIGLCIAGVLLLVAGYCALSNVTRARAAEKGAALIARLKRRERVAQPTPPDPY